MSFLKRFGSACLDVATARRSLWNAVSGARTIRVAVIGGRKSGKTVFLTALANHLRDHRKNEFPINGLSVHWNPQAMTGSRIHDLPMFDYNGARGRLAKGFWPKKTTDTTVLAMELLVEDASRRSRERVQLEVLDLPGERIADFAMMGRSYQEWCECREQMLAGPNGTSPSYQDYLNAVVRMGAGDETALVELYKDFIAYEYAHYAPDVTPSTLRLGIDGKNRDGDADEFRASIWETPVGFTDERGKVCEFIPLPMSCFDKASPFRPLVKKFGVSYDRYVKRVVRPMEKWLKKAQKMFYLVDVLTLLQAGADAWDAEKQNINAAVSALCPHADNVFARIWRWTKGIFWKTQINTVYVVATKADLVATNSDRTRLKGLIDELAGNTLPFLAQGIKTLTLSCAAVCSTEEVEGEETGERGLRGMIKDSDDGKPELQCWIPSPVPPTTPASAKEWKERFMAGDFNYQFAFPALGTAEVCPPPHLGLNVLAGEIFAK